MQKVNFKEKLKENEGRSENMEELERDLRTHLNNKDYEFAIGTIDEAETLEVKQELLNRFMKKIDELNYEDRQRALNLAVLGTSLEELDEDGFLLDAMWEEYDKLDYDVLNEMDPEVKEDTLEARDDLLREYRRRSKKNQEQELREFKEFLKDRKML
jgi:hypothetical protein